MLSQDKLRWHELREQQLDLLGEATVIADRLRHAHAKRHLKEGFNRRLLMMEVSAREIERTSRENTTAALTPYTTAKLTLFLNGFYLNLRGALDNLAWTLAYEFDLRSEIDEKNAKCQRFCSLFNKKFQEGLADYPEVVEVLRRFDAWYRDLRALRDPAAHRIPLSFPGSMLSPDEGVIWDNLQERSTELSQQARDALAAGELHLAERFLDNITDLQNQASSLGRFVPVIITSEATGHQNRSAPEQMEQDERNFLLIGRAILIQCFGKAA